MKRCPQCGKQYPDSEDFCDTDGSKLATEGAGRATTVMPEAPSGEEGGALECPVCGGRAQPGEVICNFCGTRLAPPDASAPPPSRPAPLSRLTPENFVPAHDRIDEHSGPGGIADPPTDDSNFDDHNRVEGRGIFGLLGFALAAIVALAAGAWFALYLSRRNPAPVAQASPSASPSPAMAAAPEVELARSMPIQVRGDLAGSLDRSPDALRKTFDSGKDGLMTVYKGALDSDSSAHDGMVVRLHIAPDGTVTGGAVRVSTSPDPSLDAEVIRTMSGWKFPPAKGGPVDADFPVLFASGPAEAARVESNLNTKLASLGPNEAPEYAFAPSTPAASATPAEAAASPPAASASPEMASAPSPAAAAAAPSPEEASAPSPAAIAPESTPAASARRRRRRSEEMASTAPPAHMRQPPLSDRVATAISAHRRLRHVQTNTNGSAVTLSGKVFDNNDKMLAERIARGVSGVSSVSNYIATSTGEWAQNQARIARELQNAGLSGVNVKVIGRSAYLSGQVKTDMDRQRAVTVAEQAAPVKVRENLITVAPGSMFGF